MCGERGKKKHEKTPRETRELAASQTEITSMHPCIHESPLLQLTLREQWDWKLFFFLFFIPLLLLLHLSVCTADVILTLPLQFHCYDETGIWKSESGGIIARRMEWYREWTPPPPHPPPIVPLYSRKKDGLQMDNLSSLPCHGSFTKKIWTSTERGFSSQCRINSSF